MGEVKYLGLWIFVGWHGGQIVVQIESVWPEELERRLREKLGR